MSRKLMWYWNRLLSMSPEEMAFRARRLGEQEMRRLRLRIGRVVIEDHELTQELDMREEESILGYFRDRTNVQFFPRATENDIAPEYLQNTCEAADELCLHQFRFFGVLVDLEDGIDWHYNWLTGLRWPDEFYADIDWQRSPVGGVRHTWELNRHQHFVTLAKAYWLTNDEGYATEICRQWNDWIGNNPPYMGINWVSPMEMALRLIAWCWTLSLVLKSSALTESLLRDILRTALLMARSISQSFSRYSSANNHLIAEAAGLAFFGLFFPEFKESRGWVESGLKIMVDEASKQILEDGVGSEQATSYLAFVLELYIQIILLARLNNVHVDASMLRQVEKACEFLAMLMDKNGNVPAIGDSDDGYAIKLAETPFNRAKSIVATISVICERADLASFVAKFDEVSYWLLGLRGKEAFEELAQQEFGLQFKSSAAFHSGGYYMMKTPDHLAVIDCGPLGHLSIAAHGHADCLSMFVSAFGQPMLIDPGTFCYTEDPHWRNVFRGTALHNTVRVDRVDQSVIAGPYLWSKKAEAELQGWYSGKDFDYFAGKHDGYLRRRHPVLHERQILFVRPDYWVIVDSIIGEGNHVVEQCFSFAPGESRLDSVALQVDVELPGGAGMRLTSIGNDEVKADLLVGSQNPPAGWWSPTYQQKLPAPSVRFTRKDELPVKFFAVLEPYLATPPPREITAIPVEQGKVPAAGAGIRIAEDSRADYVIIADGGQAAISQFTLLGKMAFVRKGSGDCVTGLFVSQAKRLSEAGNDLLEAPRSLEFLSASVCDSILEIDGDLSAGLKLRFPGTNISGVRTPNGDLAYRQIGDQVVIPSLDHP